MPGLATGGTARLLLPSFPSTLGRSPKTQSKEKSVRHPGGIVSEESVDETYLIDNEETEAEAY